MNNRPDSNQPLPDMAFSKPPKRPVFRAVGWFMLSFLAFLSLMAGLRDQPDRETVDPGVAVHSPDSTVALEATEIPAPHQLLSSSSAHPFVQKRPDHELPSAHHIPMGILKTNHEVMPTGHLVRQPETKPTKGRILIVRGIFTVFSLGMDDLGKKLEQLGYQVKVTTSAKSYHESDQLCSQILRSKQDAPLIIIGHSLGGDLAPKLANTFAEREVAVDMLIMLDSTMPSAPPQNVKRCVNLYQSNSSPSWARVFRGTDINAQSEKTQMFNVDIRKLAGRNQTADINHFNIDANPWIHDLIVEAVSLSHEPIDQTAHTSTQQPRQTDGN